MKNRFSKHALQPISVDDDNVDHPRSSQSITHSSPSTAPVAQNPRVVSKQDGYCTEEESGVYAPTLEPQIGKLEFDTHFVHSFGIPEYVNEQTFTVSQCKSDEDELPSSPLTLTGLNYTSENVLQRCSQRDELEQAVLLKEGPATVVAGIPYLKKAWMALTTEMLFLYTSNTGRLHCFYCLTVSKQAELSYDLKIPRL